MKKTFCFAPTASGGLYYHPVLVRSVGSYSTPVSSLKPSAKVHNRQCGANLSQIIWQITATFFLHRFYLTRNEHKRKKMPNPQKRELSITYLAQIISDYDFKASAHLSSSGRTPRNPSDIPVLFGFPLSMLE